MSSTSASASPSSSTTSAFLADNTFVGFGSEVDLSFQAVFKAQEQLHQSLEVRQEEMWQWMEMQWEEWMLERDLVVLVVSE